MEPYWDEELYDQDKLEYKDTYNKPNDQIESDDLITDAHVSDALRYALIDLWTVNQKVTRYISITKLSAETTKPLIAVIDDPILPHISR